MSETPSTELEAVNVILINMGEAPLNSLTGDLPLDALKAQTVLTEISRSIQTRGWFWNREITTLAVDGTGKIPVPTNVVAVKRVNAGPNLTLRDGYLYRIEPNNNGNVFTDAQTVELTYFLPFLDMPPVAKRFVTLKAARVFQARELGDELLLRQDTTEEQTAWADMRAEENANSNRNLKSAFDVQMVTSRRGSVITR